MRGGHRVDSSGFRWRMVRRARQLSRTIATAEGDIPYNSLLSVTGRNEGTKDEGAVPVEPQGETWTPETSNARCWTSLELGATLPCWVVECEPLFVMILACRGLLLPFRGARWSILLVSWSWWACCRPFCCVSVRSAMMQLSCQ